MSERKKEIRRKQRRRKRARAEKTVYVLVNSTGLREVYHSKGNCLSLRMKGSRTTLRTKTINWCRQRDLRPCGRCAV